MLPAERLRKDLGRPCPGRSGPAQSGGQPSEAEPGRRPSTRARRGRAVRVVVLVWWVARLVTSLSVLAGFRSVSGSIR